MKLSRSALIIVVVGLFLGLPLQGCVFAKPLVYVAKSVSGQVVDADSGQPLEGVIVTINWELRGGMHEYPQGQAHVDETVTDARGQFLFPGWGPKPAPVTAHLYSSAPQLLFFKSGYEWDKCDSDLDTNVNTRFPLSSDCDGKTIKLNKFTGSTQEYAQKVGQFEDYLDRAFLDSGGNCEWKQVPHLLVAVDQEKTRLAKAMGIPRGSKIEHWGIEDWEGSFSPAYAQRCGSMKEFLRGYLP